MAADCKSAGFAFEGSNPSLPTSSFEGFEESLRRPNREETAKLEFETGRFLAMIYYLARKAVYVKNWQKAKQI